MTCIAGMVDKDGAGHIGSDSMGSDYHTKCEYKNSKIFRKDDMLIGYTSSYRMGQLLEHSLVLPQRKEKQTTENYMYVDFVNAIRTLLKDNGYMKIISNNEEIGTFIIVTEGHVYTMQDDLALMESKEDFATTGSGQAYAQATLSLLKKQDTLTPKEMLTEAINMAITYIPTVGGEIKYLTDKTR